MSIWVVTPAGTSIDGSTSAATVTMTTRPNEGSCLPSQTRTILVSSSWPSPASTPTALLPNRPEKSDSWAQTDIGIFLLSLLSLLFFGALSAAIHHFWVKARSLNKLRQLPPPPPPLPPPPAPPQYEPVLVPSSAMTSGTTPVGNTVRYDLENWGERERTTPLPYEPELSVDEPNTEVTTVIPMKLIKEDGMKFGFGRNARCLSPPSMYLGTSAGGSRDRHGVARGISTIERYRRQARWLPNPITLLIEIVVNISVNFVFLFSFAPSHPLSPPPLERSRESVD
ncbi:hypothetical protein FRC18_002187 [Serendipita sp. 400]|nr:hypothetical protein FRC18_002187 [Serendipita sp. 400]